MPNQARKAAFINSAADYKIDDGEDFRVTINAKDFPDSGQFGQFRVYRVYGDITKPDRLHNAICNLLASRGLTKRNVVVSL